MMAHQTRIQLIKNWIEQHRSGKSFWLVFWLILFAFVVPGARPDFSDADFQTVGTARDYLFDFAAWELGTLADKMLNAAAAPQRYMTEAERTQYVRDYLQLVYDIAQLEIQVQNIYIAPGIDDPEAASADLRAERDALRTEQESRQALAESIIQAQVSEMLVEYGFGTIGQPLPPVVMRFTQLPTILILSPRDRIERIGSYPLEHGMTVEQMEQLEDNILQTQNLSAIIEPLGGLAVYPAMLIETGYAPHVFDISAHEWSHHYLSFFPLGFNYGRTPDLYTINETVANIIGDEIGWAVLDRYYPDLAPPPPDYTPTPPQPESPPADEEQPAFDYQAEMHQTRVYVDELLAAGKLEEAEAYMEARRIVFVEQGYRLRKLNQAYFAFHGAYADQPGATGSDPIGPAIRELRYYSPSLYEFVKTIRSLTTFEEIQIALEDARYSYAAGY